MTRLTAISSTKQLTARRIRSLSVIAGIAAGTVIPIQSRLNGELSQRLDDGIAAATISFLGGLVLLTFLALFSPALRLALRRLISEVRQGRLPRRYLLAGVLGGIFALAQSTVALVTGIAVFTVAAIAGQTISGLIVDARGIGGGIKQRPSSQRLTAAIIVLVAAVLSAAPTLAGASSPSTVLFPALGALLAGFLLGMQQAMNGASGKAAGSPLAATWMNFCVGSIFLGAAFGVKTLAGGSTGRPLPTDWWVYIGGACGVIFIGACAILVHRIGVLLLGMTSIGGQLVSSIVLDVLVPSGSQGPQLLTILGAVLTFAAIGIASYSRGVKPLRPATARNSSNHTTVPHVAQKGTDVEPR